MAVAYREQAVGQFERSPIHQLIAHGAPKALGVYGLYLEQEGEPPVYVGKATKITIAKRLSEHAAKIDGRRNIDVADVWCRYLVIDQDGEEWVAASAESHLIKHYTPKWNKSGFGGHVPGEGRPGVRAVPWEEWYPKR